MTAELSVPRIDVGLVANDKESALAFWNGLLGFPVLGEMSFPGLTVVKLGVGESILRIAVPDQPVARLASTAGFSSETGLRYVTLQVRNLVSLVDAARAAGYPVSHAPRELRPGIWVAQIEDGAGATVELQQIDPT